MSSNAPVVPLGLTSVCDVFDGLTPAAAVCRRFVAETQRLLSPAAEPKSCECSRYHQVCACSQIRQVSDEVAKALVHDEWEEVPFNIYGQA